MNKRRISGIVVWVGAASVLFTGCPQTAPTTAATPGLVRQTPPLATATPVASASVSPPPFATNSGATEYKSAEAGVSVTIPAGWHQEEKDGMVTAGSVDGTVSVFLQVLDATTLENIGDHVNEHLKDLVSDPRPNKKGNNEEINGLKVYSVRGTGSKDGKPCEWVVDFVASKKILMLVYVGETAGLQQNQARLATMIASIKPTEDAPTAAATSASEAQDAVSEAVATASPEAR